MCQVKDGRYTPGRKAEGAAIIYFSKQYELVPIEQVNIAHHHGHGLMSMDLGKGPQTGAGFS